MSLPPTMAQESSPAAKTGGTLIPLIMLLIVGVVWGAIFTVNKAAAEAAVPPLAYAFWSIFIAGVAMAVLSLIFDGRPKLGPKYLLFYFISGVANFGFAIILFAYAAPKLPAGVITLVMMMTPTMTYLFAFVLRIDRFRTASFLGLILGIIGVLVIVLPEFSLPTREMAGWFLLVLLGPTSFAVGNVYVAVSRPPEMPGLMATAGLCLGAAVFILPVLLVVDGTSNPLTVSSEGAATMVIAAAIYCITLTFFFEIIRRAGPLFWSQIGYISVVSGIVWGIIVFGEQHSAGIWLGAALMFGGLALVNSGVRAAAREESKAPAG